MAKKLTKGVLNGTDFKETMTVEFGGEEFEVDIRPLNNSEAETVEEHMQSGLNLSMKPSLKGQMQRHMDIDSKKNLKGRNQSDIKSVALGTVDEDITEDVVRNEFPNKIVRDIAKRIKQISGIGNQEQVQEFSENEENPSE